MSDHIIDGRSVMINGRKVVVQRPTLAKASRVHTLLQRLQTQVPEIARRWGDFHKKYAQEFAYEMDRAQATIQFGDALAVLKEADWERMGQKLVVPGKPSPAEVFFELAPLVYERAEETTLRLLGIIALDNETVSRYGVPNGDIWPRVDEFVAEVIRPAPLDEIVELLVVATEVIDGSVLAKLRQLQDRVEKAKGLFGVRKEATTTETTTTSSEQPVVTNTVSSTDSAPSDTDTPTPSASPTTPSSTSSVVTSNDSTQNEQQRPQPLPTMETAQQ